MHELIADLFYIEKATFCPDVGLAKVFDTIDNCGTDSEGNAIIVRLANSTDSGDVMLVHDTLCNIYDMVRGLLKVLREDIPETPFSVMMRSGLNSSSRFTSDLTCSSSIA